MATAGKNHESYQLYHSGFPHPQITIPADLKQKELSKLHYLFLSPRKLLFCVNLEDFCLLSNVYILTKQPQ